MADTLLDIIDGHADEFDRPPPAAAPPTTPPEGIGPDGRLHITIRPTPPDTSVSPSVSQQGPPLGAPLGEPADDRSRRGPSLLDIIDGPGNPRAALESVAGRDPDAARRNDALARKTGLPDALIAVDPDRVGRAVEVDELDRATSNSPIVRDILLDPRLGPAVRDDTDPLTAIEYAAHRGQDVGSGALTALGMSLSGIGELNAVAARSLTRAVRATGLDDLADFLESPLLPWWLDPTQILKRPGEEIKAVADAVDSGDEGLDADIARGLGQLGAQVALYLMTGGASGTAAGVAAARTISTITMTGQGADIMAERGAVSDASQLERDLATVTGGAVTALTERFGLDRILNRVAPNIKNNVMRFLVDVALAGGIEAAQEVVEGLLHNLTARALLDPDAEIFEGLEREAGAAFGAASIFRVLVNAVVKGRQTVRDSGQAILAEDYRKRIASILDAAGQSKLAADNPALFQEVLDRIVADSSVETVGVNAAGLLAFYQAAGTPEQAVEFFESAGIDRAVIERAMRLGIDIEIDTAAFVAALQGTEIVESVLANVREDGGDTLAEAEVKTAETQARLEEVAKGVAADVAAALEGDETLSVEDAAARVGERLTEKILAATPHRADEAAKIGALYEAFARVVGQAKRDAGDTDFDVESFIDEYGVAEIRRGRFGEAAAETAAQAGADARPVFSFSDETQVQVRAINSRIKALKAEAERLLEAGNVKGIDEGDLAGATELFEQRLEINKEIQRLDDQAQDIRLAELADLAAQRAAQAEADVPVSEMVAKARQDFETRGVATGWVFAPGGPEAAIRENIGPEAADEYRAEYDRLVQEAVAERMGRTPPTLEQSAAPLQRRPLRVKGTLPGGRVRNWDLAEALTKRHMEKYGRTLDPENEADYKIILRDLNKEYREQLAQEDTGSGWYVEDIAQAIEITTLIIPELADPLNRDLFLTMAALLSPRQKPRENWENSILAMQGYLETGRIPTRKPNGKQFGVEAHTSGLLLLQHLIDQHGLEGALTWVREPHTGAEIAEARRDSGLFVEKKTLSEGTAAETKLSGTYLGIYMMGPKVGDFMMNATGIDQDAVTVDLWLARTYNRHLGRLLDVAPKNRETLTIASDVRGPKERARIKRIVRDLAARNNIDPSAMQAALWYFEQRLYRNHGVNSDSQNFSGAAQAAAEKRSIAVPGADQDVSGVGEAAPTGARELLQTDRARDQLTPEQIAAVVAAANLAHSERLHLSSITGGDTKFSLDDILVDAGAASLVDAGDDLQPQRRVADLGNLPLSAVAVPANAADGDTVPLSAVRDWDRLWLPNGEIDVGRPSFEAYGLTEDDFELTLIDPEHGDDGGARLDLKNETAVSDRLATEIAAEDTVDTIEEALGHADHHARAAAFRAVLDALDIEYYTVGAEGIASEYVYVDIITTVDTSYRLQHQPPDPEDGAARLDDMTGGGTVFPSDIYSSEGLRYYGNPSNAYDRESFNIIQEVRNKPWQEVTIYRAVPKDVDVINPGDFVTISEDYANLHASSGYGPSGEDAGAVLSEKVRVGDLFSAGNDLNEFGYFPSDDPARRAMGEPEVKIRFADHGWQSPLHERADHNIADGGYGEAISALSDILSRVRGDTTLFQTDRTLGLYSQAAEAARSLPQDTATGQQIKDHLKNNGVKNAELEWIVGLDEFLASAKTITKADLVAFIEQNGIALDEVVLGTIEAGTPDAEAAAAAAEEADARRDERNFELFRVERDQRLLEERIAESDDPAMNAVFRAEQFTLQDEHEERLAEIRNADIEAEAAEAERSRTAAPTLPTLPTDPAEWSREPSPTPMATRLTFDDVVIDVRHDDDGAVVSATIVDFPGRVFEHMLVDDTFDTLDADTFADAVAAVERERSIGDQLAAALPTDPAEWSREPAPTPMATRLTFDDIAIDVLRDDDGAVVSATIVDSMASVGLGLAGLTLDTFDDAVAAVERERSIGGQGTLVAALPTDPAEWSQDDFETMTRHTLDDSDERADFVPAIDVLHDDAGAVVRAQIVNARELGYETNPFYTFADAVAAIESERGIALTRDRSRPTRFDQYTLPGGENHREFFLTLPAAASPANAKVGDWLVPPVHQIGDEIADNRLVVRIRVNDRVDADGKRTLFVEEIQGDRQQEAQRRGGFTAGTLAEREAERAALEAERDALLPAVGQNLIQAGNLGFDNRIEAIHALTTHGRGRLDPVPWTETWDVSDLTDQQIAELDRYIEVRANLLALQTSPRKLVGPIPFAASNEWAALALKRVIARAVEEGYDAVGWTPGEVQAKRYDLSAVLDSIEYLQIAKPASTQLGTPARMTYDLYGYEKNTHRKVIDEMGVEEKDLAKHVGKDLADKIIAGEGKVRGAYKRFGGIDLEVGGEGLKALYDKTIPNIANKIGKKFGAKTRVTEVETKAVATDRRSADFVRDLVDDPAALDRAEAEQLLRDGYEISGFHTEAGAGDTIYSGQIDEIGEYSHFWLEPLQAAAADLDVDGEFETQDVWSLPITDELRETVTARGLPMFQDPPDISPPASPLGSYNPDTRAINLFESADFSTLLHESGHAFVHMLGVLAAPADAPQSLRDNYEAMLDWVGAESADDLDVTKHGQAAIDKQEKLARAFEAYLMAGEAPSTRLRASFAQFKAWLVTIYTRLRQLGATIDPEIAAVFDRMLATDAEIEEARDANALGADASPSIRALMTDAQRAVFDEADEEADGEVRVQHAALEAVVQERAEAEWYRDEKLRVRGEVTDEVWSRAPYRALWFLTRGVFREGETLDSAKGRRISKAALLDAGMTQADLDALPRAKKRIYADDETALAPEGMAALLGFDSGVELMSVLKGLAKVQDVIDAETDAVMRERHGDPMTDGTRETLTEEASYSDLRRRAIQIELDTLAGRVGQPAPSRGVIKDIVDQLFEDRPVGELLTPMRYQAASVRAAKAAERAAAAGDHQTAFDEKRKQLLNHELFRRALKARDEVQKINKKLRNYQTRKYDGTKMDPDYIGQILGLLRFYGVGAVSKKAFEGQAADTRGAIARQILSFINEKIAVGEPLILPGDLVDLVRVDADGKAVFAFKFTHWRDMTLLELRALRDVADNLAKRGRANSEVEREKLRTIAKKLAEGIRDNTRPRPGRKTKLARPTSKELTKDAEKGGFLYDHRKLESLLRELDGFEDVGPMWEAIFRPIAEGRGLKIEMVEKVMNDIDAVIGGKYTRKQRKLFGDEKSAVPIQALGGDTLTREQRVMIALNWGNESSREAILSDQYFIDAYGEAWNEAAIQEILETLDDTDLDVVEGVWGIVNQFWDDFDLRGKTVNGIATLQRESTGVAPPKVEAAPFVVNGRQLGGGYFPLSYDGRLSSRVAIEKQDDVMKAAQSGGFSHATTRHGHTNARVGSGGRPVTLSINVLMGHLEDVTHDLAFRDSVTRADAILRQEVVRDAIVEALGMKGYNAMRNVLVKVAAGNRPADMGAGDRIMRNARINVTSALMGLNIRVILLQWLGMFQTVARIGTGRSIQGLAEFWVNPVAAVREIHEASTFMRERGRMMTRELDDIANTISMPNLSDKIKELGFRPIVWADVYLVAYPSWLGARAQAYAGRVKNVAARDDAAAVRYADSVIRTTQGAGGQENLSMIQQTNEMWKLLTMFGSYFNTTMNMQVEAWQKFRLEASRGHAARGGAHLLGQTILLQMLPAILAGLLLESWPDDEGEDELTVAWAKWYGLQLANHMGAQVFVARDIIHGVTSPFGVSLTPVEGVFESGAKVVKDLKNIPEYIENGEVPLQAAKNLVRFAATAKGVPGTSTAIRFGDTAIKMARGDLRHPPESALEAAKDLFITGDR